MLFITVFDIMDHCFVICDFISFINVVGVVGTRY
jgi:hypothetical protein